MPAQSSQPLESGRGAMSRPVTGAMPTPDVERSALVALLSRSGTRWHEVTSTVLESGSALDCLERQLSDGVTLFETPDVETAVARAAERIASWEKAGITVRAFLEPGYPTQLRDIREMPPLVFTRGKLVEPDLRAIAVVGTRKASSTGLKRAANIATTLARQDITVVSGLAAGIDTAAHRAALDTGGRTVAVIGTGITRYYPAANQELQDEIAEHGLVLSQFWPDAAPSKISFPMRNVVMSGYAAATIVVEASEVSGTRIQARRALEHGRFVILLKDVLAADWAKDLAMRPGVMVVDGYSELDEAISEALKLGSIDLSSLGPLSVG